MAERIKRGGRKAGVPNKLSSGVKSNIIGVFEGIGGRNKMIEWAQDNLTEFYRLYSKMLPTEAHLSVEGRVDLVDLLTQYAAERQSAQQESTTYNH